MSRSAGIHRARLRRLEASDALVARQRVEPFGPGGRRAGLLFGQGAQPQQRVMKFLGVDGVGPGLGADLGDRLRIEPAEVGGALRIAPAPRHDGLCSPLFQRRVVEEGVGSGGQRLERERRRLGQIAANDTDLARFEAASSRSNPSMSIASCRQSAIA